MCWTPQNAKTNNVNRTRTLTQITGGKDEPNLVLYGYRNEHLNTEQRMERNTIGQQQQTQKMSKMDPIKSTGGKLIRSERVSSSCFL